MKKTLLTLVLLFSLAALMLSCSSDKTSTGSSGETKQQEEDSIFYERSLVSDDIPTQDFGGRVFRVVANAKSEFVIAEDEFNKGDLLKDSRASRTKAVEERFNVKIEIVYSPGDYSQEADYVSKTVLAGNDEFDLFSGMVMSLGGMVTKNLFVNWYDIPHVDFSKPWWYDSNSTELTYNGKSLIAISHLNFSAVSGVYCLYFNKNLAQSYELGDLYSIVLDGKWTFDKLSEMVKDIYVDDGNNERDSGDFYGFSQNQGTSINSYLWAFDNPVCKKNADGVPEISVKTDKINSIVSDIFDFCFNNRGVFYDKTGKSNASQLFYEKKAIFMQHGLDETTTDKLRNFEDDYGILPLPKYSEEQSEYKTMVGGHHTALAVPKTAKDLEFVGTIVEALSAESWKTVTPTLYEIALKTRYLRDSESKKIMDIIIEGTQFDFGTVYDNWQGFAFMLQRLMENMNSNFETYYKTQLPKARYQLKSTIKAIDKT